VESGRERKIAKDNIMAGTSPRGSKDLAGTSPRGKQEQRIWRELRHVERKQAKK